jgi:SAM-dependent methyltransferase
MGTTIEKATLYEKHRLPYANQAASDLLDYIGPVATVADIGAGTGQLARLFTRRASRVYAVEPDPAMREVASIALAGCQNISLLAGSAEHTTLADHAADLIVIGNAFHRFQAEACAELRRILKPSGWMALFTYSWTNRALGDLLFTKWTELKGVADQMSHSWHGMPIAALFGDRQIHTRSYHQSRIDDWTTFFGAACAWIEAPAAGDQEFASFESLNREAFEAFAINDRIEIEYDTRVVFGQPPVVA